jgi:hypothetical protein
VGKCGVQDTFQLPSPVKRYFDSPCLLLPSIIVVDYEIDKQDPCHTLPSSIIHFLLLTLTLISSHPFLQSAK